MATKKQNGTKQEKTTKKKPDTTTAKKAAPAPQAESKPRIGKQGAAVILFAVSLLILFAALIPAPEAALWNALHVGSLGVFGICAYVVPIMLGWIAVMMAMDKEVKAIAKTAWIFGGAMLLFDAVLEVFVSSVSGSFWSAVATAFTRGMALFADGGVNGGALGAIIGWPIEYLLGDVGAKITLILLLFVIVMLTTGSTLLSLWKPVKKTADFTRDKIRRTRDKIDDALDEAEAEVEATPAPGETAGHQPRSRIDVELGDGYPESEPAQDPCSRCEDAVEGVQEEQERPQIHIDDIIGDLEKGFNAVKSL